MIISNLRFRAVNSFAWCFMFILLYSLYIFHFNIYWLLLFQLLIPKAAATGVFLKAGWGLAFFDWLFDPFSRVLCVWRPITFQAASVFVSSPHHLMVCFTSAWKLCWWITSPRVPCTLLSPVLCWCFGRMAFIHQLFMDSGRYWAILGNNGKCMITRIVYTHDYAVSVAWRSKLNLIHILLEVYTNFTNSVPAIPEKSCVHVSKMLWMLRWIAGRCICWNRPNRLSIEEC